MRIRGDIGDLREVMLRGVVRDRMIEQVLDLVLHGLRAGDTTPEFQSLVADILDPSVDTEVKVKWALRHAAPKKIDVKLERAEAVWERVRFRGEAPKDAIAAVVEERKLQGDRVSAKTVEANWRTYREELDSYHQATREAETQ